MAFEVLATGGQSSLPQDLGLAWAFPMASSTAEAPSWEYGKVLKSIYETQTELDVVTQDEEGEELTTTTTVTVA